MAINYFPILVTLALIILPIFFFIDDSVRYMKGADRAYKNSIRCLVIEFSLFFICMSFIYVPAWFWMYKAENKNNAEAQYELGRWCENHYEKVQALLFCPFFALHPDCETGLRWLAVSATNNYPPAIYALGVRYKYGNFVPRPDDWTGPAGNYFPQPEMGQLFIDKAIHLGYKPTGAEEDFYWQVYRK